MVAWEHHTKLWKRNLTIAINIKDIKGLKHLKLELKLPQRCTSAVCCPITVNQCKITGICSWRPWFLPHEIRLTQTKTLFGRLPTWNLHRFLAQFHPFLRFVLRLVLLWELWFWLEISPHQPNFIRVNSPNVVIPGLLNQRFRHRLWWSW